MRLIKKGATSQSIYFSIGDSASTTGGKKTGIVYNASGLTAYYTLNGAAAVAITLATLATAATAWSSGGFVEVSSANAPGLYRLDLPNAGLTGAESCVVSLKGAAGMVQVDVEIQLTGIDIMDAVRGGMTGIPNAVAGAAGGLPLGDASGRVDLGKILGTAAATPATAGILDVNVKNMNNVAATSITTINANMGTTQPTNFTGTAGSALVKSDMVDVAGAAVSTTLAQIGVNVVNINAQTATAAAGVTFPSSIASPTNITAGTVTTATNVTTLNGIAANVITAAAIADGAIDRATFAADTGIVSIRSNTAQAGGSTSITLDASASATTDFYKNDLIIITGGTGIGQGRYCTAYNGGTKVATVSAWATNPDATSTFAIIAADAIVGATAPTAAAVATAVWTDLLAGSDFSTASSVGKLLKDDIDATVSSRMATYTQPTGFLAATFPSGTVANTTNITAGTIATVTNLTNAPTAGDLTAAMKASVTAAVPTTAQIATGVWTDTTASDFTTAASVGKSVMNGVALGTGLTVAAVSGSVGSVAGAVASVTGNVGGNVTGSVGSVVGAVGSVTGLTASNLDATVSSRLASASITLTGGAVSVDAGSKTGIRLSATGVADIWAYVVEGTHTAVGYMRIFASALAGVLSGAATTTVVIKDIDNTKTRVTATVDANGNRSAITTDET